MTYKRRPVDPHVAWVYYPSHDCPGKMGKEDFPLTAFCRDDLQVLWNFWIAMDTVGEFAPWDVWPESGQDEACWEGQSLVS
jgi:hypothetical protein